MRCAQQRPHVQAPTSHKTRPSELLVLAPPPCALTCRLEDFSRFLTHLLAWPCGSMHSGQRRALATMIPFSMEDESLGRLAMSHSRILTGSPRMDERLNLAVCGMLADLCGYGQVYGERAEFATGMQDGPPAAPHSSPSKQSQVDAIPV
jgi:hypothetical protein